MDAGPELGGPQSAVAFGEMTGEERPLVADVGIRTVCQSLRSVQLIYFKKLYIYEELCGSVRHLYTIGISAMTQIANFMTFIRIN